MEIGIQPEAGAVLAVGLDREQQRAVERGLLGATFRLVIAEDTPGTLDPGLTAGVELLICAHRPPHLDGLALLSEFARLRPRASRLLIAPDAVQAAPAGVTVLLEEEAVVRLPATVGDLLKPRVLRLEGEDGAIGLLLEVSLTAMLVADEAGRILATNSHLDDLFRYHPGELVGRAVEVLVPAPARTSHIHSRDAFAADPRPRRMTGRVVSGVTSRGEVIPLEVSLLPVSIHGQDRVVVAIADLRSLRVVDERMLRAQRLESVGLLVAGALHDLRNLTFAIHAGAELLELERGGDASSLREAVEGFDRLTREMARLLDERQAEPSPVDVNALLRRVEPMLRRVAGPVVSVLPVLDARPCVARTVDVQLEQVLLNLVVNARDAIGGPGHVTVTTRRLPHTVVVEVADDGPGMTPDVAARAFEPFFTTKPPGKGTGLGLAVSRALVERWGGTLTLTTAPGGGCAAELTLAPGP